MRFCLIAILLLTNTILHAEEPITPESVSAGGKTLAEWRKMAGIGETIESGSILFEQKTPETISTIDACRASLRAQQEVILHNLVNLRTVGYKRIIPVQIEANDPKTGQLLGSQIVELRTDFSQGPLVKTGHPLDFAIKGPGFFVLKDKKSENKRLFTRRGQFSLDENGTLGLRCGGQFYPIDPTVTISKTGVPLQTEPLKLQTFADPSVLNRSNEGFFELREKTFQKNSSPPKPGEIQQGMLEFSNVDKAAELQEWNMTTKLLKETSGN